MRLAVNKLCGQRGGQPIFSDIDFTLTEGEALLVSGPNGVGKSTLLRIIAGLLPPLSGEVVLEYAAPFLSVRSACHYLSHTNGLKLTLTVYENLLFWQNFNGEPQKKIHEALEMVGLNGLDTLPVDYLSMGQRRRIAIAKLLVSYRPIWLLDEPTIGLDARSEDHFTALMQDYLNNGGIIIAATHLSLGLDKAKMLPLQEQIS